MSKICYTIDADMVMDMDEGWYSGDYSGADKKHFNCRTLWNGSFVDGTVLVPLGNSLYSSIDLCDSLSFYLAKYSGVKQFFTHLGTVGNLKVTCGDFEQDLEVEYTNFWKLKSNGKTVGKGPILNRLVKAYLEDKADLTSNKVSCVFSNMKITVEMWGYGVKVSGINVVASKNTAPTVVTTATKKPADSDSEEVMNGGGANLFGEDEDW